jgi:hypothetical protein
MAWAPTYATAESLAHYMASDGFDLDRIEEERVELENACESGSRAVDDTTNRQFGVVAAPEAREYTLEWSDSKCMWYAEVDDFQTTTGMVLAFDTARDGTYTTTIANTYAVPALPNAVKKGLAHTRIYLRSTVPAVLDGRALGFRATIKWGWTAVPLTVVNAAHMQASRFYARRNSPYGVAGSPQDGSEIRLAAKADPDVRVSLKRYWRNRWAS